MFKNTMYLKAIALCFLLCTTAFYGFSQTFEKATDYMDYMALKKREITANHMSYTSAVAHGKSARKVEKLRIELIASNLEGINKIKYLKGWNNDIAYRDSTVSYLRTLYHILKEDYAKIVDLEEVAEQSYDAMEAYLKIQELASEKLEQAGDRLEEEQKIFAKNNNINLIEGDKDELSLKVEKTNKVLEYKQEIFLIFFRCNNQEKYLVEAMNKKDMNALEQNRSALEKYSTENLTKLAAIKPFNGDNSMVDACRKALQFYLNEAKEQIPQVQDFFAKQSDFAKISKAFEAKSKSATQADVDAYNKSVNDINTATTKFNTLNNLTNKTRTEVVNSWNSTSDLFLDKHIPKY